MSSTCYFDDFPDCCGIYVITELWGNMLDTDKGGSKNPYEYTPKYKKVLKENLEMMTQDSPGLTLIALNNRQKEHLHTTLLAFGFVPLVEDFYNSNHQSKLTLYGFLSHPTKIDMKLKGNERFKAQLEAKDNPFVLKRVNKKAVKFKKGE